MHASVVIRMCRQMHGGRKAKGLGDHSVRILGD
jgi:hypothetical protein